MSPNFNREDNMHYPPLKQLALANTVLNILADAMEKGIAATAYLRGNFAFMNEDTSFRTCALGSVWHTACSIEKVTELEAKKKHLVLVNISNFVEYVLPQILSSEEIGLFTSLRVMDNSHSIGFRSLEGRIALLNDQYEGDDDPRPAIVAQLRAWAADPSVLHIWAGDGV